jgi:hypothetical protein
LAGGNINGDFVATNDLAFVFDRNNQNIPANIRTGLQTLLDNPDASQSLKDYINKYSGQIAERNGGVNDFFGIVDLKLSYQLQLNKKHSIEFSGDVFNFANLLNKKWGVNETLGNQALYAVSAFDATNKAYTYRVNNTGIVTPTGNPWQAQIGLRYGF